MGPRTRRRRIDHARYVGLPPTPGVWPTEASSRRSIDRRLALVAGVVVVLLAASAVTATMLGNGGPKPATAADLAAAGSRPAASTRAAIASVAGPVTSPSPAATATAAPTPIPPAALTGYRWPLDHGRITTPFGPVLRGLFVVDGQPFHDGLDIATFCGDHIVAAHDGVVLASGRHVIDWLGWVGNVAAYKARITSKNLWGAQAVMVITDDGNGYRSVYVHLYEALVKVGQHVKAGDLIGYEGLTGDATGCHLHYSVFDPLDPGRFQTDPASVKRSALPAQEVARIDPFTVLPPMSTTKLTWGWGAEPSPSSAPSPTP